jgi:tetratricopeptide (TPR) repeat protein
VTLAWALPLLVVMQSRSAAVSPRPVAWAAQSPRPSACQGSPGLWELSRQAQVLRRCQDLARAQALLIGAPDKALARAARLLKDAPDFAEARVLRGRAALRVGDSATALADLSSLLSLESVTVADPAALWDGGRAALAQGDAATAARFYRTLGSRAALLPERRQQVEAYLEIAAALLAADGAPVDDVLAYLREARRRSPGSGFSGLCAALTAVAWASAGREAEGQGLLAEIGDVDELARFEARQEVWLPDGMFHALLGLALETSRPEISRQHYEALAKTALAKTSVGKLPGRSRSRAPAATAKSKAREGR